MHRPSTIFVALALAACASLAQAEVAAIIPPTPPALEKLPTLVKDLSNRDPLVRGDARNALMLLSRDDLPVLRTAVANVAPLDALQRGTLHEIVVHVHLTGVHNFAGRGPGFLGVSLSIADQMRVLVTQTTPGRDSARVLRASDIVVGIRDDRSTDFTPTPSVDTLRFWLQARPIGTWVRVKLVRDGAEMEADLRLGPTPANPNLPAEVAAEDRAIATAEQYWSDQFAQLVTQQTPATTRPAASTAP